MTEYGLEIAGHVLKASTIRCRIFGTLFRTKPKQFEQTLMIPRTNRILISEKAMWAAHAPGISAARRTFSDPGGDLETSGDAQADAAYTRKSLRRLSDLVGGESNKRKQLKTPSIGSKRDVWQIAFTDVMIRCQRVGVTKLPLGTAQLARVNQKGVSIMARERNLYKFLKVDHWVMQNQTAAKPSGVINMEEVARSRWVDRIEESPLPEGGHEELEEGQEDKVMEPAINEVDSRMR